MASKNTQCWKPVQKAPRVDEMELYSEEELLIFNRLREKYSCSKQTLDRMLGKTDCTKNSRLPDSRSVSFSREDEIQIKREPLTPTCTIGSPRQTAGPGSFNRDYRFSVDTHGHGQEQDIPIRWAEADPENQPLINRDKEWGKKKHSFIPPSHKHISSRNCTGNRVEDNRNQPISFDFHEAQQIPDDQSSTFASRRAEYRREAVGWDCDIPEGDADLFSCLSPIPKMTDLPQHEEKHDLNVSRDELHPHRMPYHSENLSKSDTYSTRKRQHEQERSPRTLLADLHANHVQPNPRWTASSIDLINQSRPNSPQENENPALRMLADNVSAGRKQPSSHTPVHMPPTPQTLYQGQLSGSLRGAEDRHRLSVPAAHRIVDTDTAPHKKKTPRPAQSTHANSRESISAYSVQGEDRPSAKQRKHACSDRKTTTDKNLEDQPKITDFVKQKTIPKRVEQNSVGEEEDDEDPLSILDKRQHKTSNSHTSLPDGVVDESALNLLRGVVDANTLNLPSGVDAVIGMDEERRQHLSAILLEDRSPIGLLVLHEDGTTNTDSSVLNNAKVEGVLLRCRESSYLLPIPERCDSRTSQWIRKLLQDLLSSKETVKVAINCKRLAIALLREFSLGDSRGAVAWLFEDPMVAGYLLSPDDPPHTLHALCKTTRVSCTNEGPGVDLKMSMVVMDKLRPRLARENLWLLFLHVEMTLAPLLAVMELEAIRVNVQAFLTSSQILKKKMEKVEKKAYELAGHTFCINSTQQLRQLLYEELRLDQQLQRKVALTATAHHKSTSEATLKHMVSLHPLPAVILEYRHLCKLKSTYVDGLLEAVVDGALHTHWDQTSAATGRLVSAQPNLQAIPKTATTITDIQDDVIVGTQKESCDIYAREPFVANEGNIFLAADFQQIELRLLAHLANDPALKHMFRSSEDNPADIFIQLTAQWLAKAYKDVTHAEREQTKRVVYSILYGVGKERLAEYLKMSPSRAKDIMDSFLVSFPAIQVFTKKCVDYAQKHGYTETVMGRKRWLDVHHRAAPVRAQAERQAINFCVQGSAADLCKRAMVKVEEALRDKPHLSARLLMHIHDELVWELPKEQLPEMCELVKREMEDDVSLCRPMLPGLTVPITVSLSAGATWAHLSPCP